MNKIKTNISAGIGKIASILPLKSVIKFSNVNLVLPFYHTVSNEQLTHIKHLYEPRTVKQFENDIDFLLKNFNPASLEELLKNSKQETIRNKKPSFHLSFDDGLKQVKTVVAPILKRKGIPATVFCNTAFIDNNDLFFRFKESLLVNHIEVIKESDIDFANISEILKSKVNNKSDLSKNILSIKYLDRCSLDDLAIHVDFSFDKYLKNNDVYLSSDDISELQKDGFSIGSHSIDHPNFIDLFIDEQFNQIKESSATISKKFKPKINTFSFPFTDYGVQAKLLDKMHNQNIIDISFGCAGMKGGRFSQHFQRIPMEIEGRTGEDIIKFEYLYYILKKIVGKSNLA